MSDLDTLKKALDSIGIDYSIRERGEFQYLFIGNYKDIRTNYAHFEECDIESLLSCHKFIEFENGKLSSYFTA